MNFKHKPGVAFRSVLVIMLFFIAGLIALSSNRVTYAKNEKNSAKISQKARNLDKIIINNQAFKEKREGPVTFDHIKHAMKDKITCWECHHDYNKKGKNIYRPWNKTQKCAECHHPSKIKKKVAGQKKVENQGKVASQEKTVSQEKTAGQEKTVSKGKAAGKKKAVSKKKVVSLQAAYHLLCKKCHEKRKIFGNKTLAYRECTTCHKKPFNPNFHR